MINPSVPNLSRPGSSTPWILPRPAWQTAARDIVRRVLASAGFAALVCLAIALLLTWIGAPVR